MPITALPVPTKTIPQVATEIISAIDGVLGTAWHSSLQSANFNSVSRVLTLNMSDGRLITVAIPGATDTLTTLAYNSVTRILTYTGENGLATAIDLSNLATDVYVTGGTYDAATMRLTLTDNNGTTPNIVIDFSGMVVTLLDNGDGTYSLGDGRGPTSIGIINVGNEVVVANADLTGAAPAGAELGVNRVSGQTFFADGSGNWQPVPGSGEFEVVRAAGALTGAAPAGAEVGVDTTTGQMYYVDGSGNWQPVPIASVDLNTTVSSQAGSIYPGTPIAAPAGSAAGDVHVETYDDFIAWYVSDGVGGWTVSATSPVGVANEFEVVSSAGALTGAAPAGAELGVDTGLGQLYYVDGSGNWQPVPAVVESEVVRDAVDLAGVAPAGAEWGINTTSGKQFFVDAAGNWIAAPASELEVIRNAGALSGAAPAGAEVGVDGTTGKLYYVDGSGNWQPVQAAAEAEVVRSPADLSGAAPSGAEWGINTTSGKQFFVDASGNWTVAPANELEVVRNAGALTGAAPAGAEVGVNATSGQLYYVDGSGNWQPVPSSGSIYLSDGTLVANRTVNGGGRNLTFTNVAAASILATNAVIEGSTSLVLKSNSKLSVWPTETPMAGEFLRVSSVSGASATLEWASASGAELEVISNAGALSGAAPAGAEVGVDNTTGQMYYVDGSGNWQSAAAASMSEVLRQGGDLTGAAPANMKLGVNSVDGTLFYASSGGNWEQARALELEVVSNAGALSGAAPAGAEVGIDTTTGQFYYVDGSGTWQSSAMGTELEVVMSSGALSGAAPVGAKVGINNTTGTTYFVNSSGNWQTAPYSGGTAFKTTVSDETGSSYSGTPLTHPPGPSAGDLHIEIYDDKIAWYVFELTTAAQWGVAATVGISGLSNNIYTQDGTLTANRTLDGGGNNLTVTNTDATMLESRVLGLVADDDITLGVGGVLASWPTDAPNVGDVLSVFGTGAVATLHWSPPTSVSEVVMSSSALTGAAPAGAKVGVNTTSGTTYYVNASGNWAQVVAASSATVATSDQTMDDSHTMYLAGKTWSIRGAYGDGSTLSINVPYVNVNGQQSTSIYCEGTYLSLISSNANGVVRTLAPEIELRANSRILFKLGTGVNANEELFWPVSPPTAAGQKLTYNGSSQLVWA
jgi:hypothetical protein